MNTGKYDLISIDFDGTLLDSRKNISKVALDALKRAGEAGKIVITGTGRARNELKPYESILPLFRAAGTESGSYLLDLRAGEVIGAHFLPPSIVEAVRKVIPLEDMLPQVVTKGHSVINASDLPHMERYQMGLYRPLYESVTDRVESVDAYLSAHCTEIGKINLYHTTREASRRTAARLAGLDCILTEAEDTSLEVSPAGVDKGTGLLEIAAYYGIPRERTIAVGDAWNDIPMIRAAGLGIAVANANETVRAAADIVVPDNDHDGCVLAIDRYLLG